jgi:hypothetical protein
VILYIERWLTALFQMEDGQIVERRAGTLQGGVISLEAGDGKIQFALKRQITGYLHRC